MSIPAPRPGAVALVTGASSGIGEALARALAVRGHDMVLVARRRERLEALAAELRRQGRRVEIIAADVSEPSERERVLARIEKLGLAVDILIPCAGFGLGGPFVDAEPDGLRLMLRTNVEAVVVLTRALAPAMIGRRSGAILLVSSVAGASPLPNFGVYAATKAAVTSLGEALHDELGVHDITVTVLCPGSVSTEFASVAGMSEHARRAPAVLTIDATECARMALEGLEAGARIVTPRFAVRAVTWITAHAPRRFVLPLARRALS